MNGKIVRRIECRAEGRTLSGTVLAYNDISVSHKERFQPGSIRLDDVVILDLEHDPLRVAAWHPSGGLDLRLDDSGIAMEAELPPIPAAEAILRGIEAAGGTLGLSVEFRAEKERKEGGLRVIEAAVLSGIGVVKRPSYPGSRLEAREGRLRVRLW